ncbi:unnamed protein product [Hermetia illucens]|uniref:Cytochrome P450 n=1 Tax=Hermetia illucens TaxID=343691 RepID=A0A7R8UAA6_HERIL|nr:probable cytochrome P450 308a1 [Hermetia illucens]CAD7077084.1 unnamed protein product [Hermetia illucens]
MLELVVIALSLLVVYFYWSANYWARKGVKAPAPLPIVGNMLDYVRARKHYGQVYQDIYNSFPNAAYVGIYRLFNEPAILVRDSEVLKDVFIKDFQSFRDNYFLFDKKMDPLLDINPFVAVGDDWKTLRSQMGSLFTSSKIKTMFPIIYDTGRKLENYIEKERKTSLEVKSLCAKYTIEIMASASFGLEAETFTNPNSHFTKHCETVFTSHAWSYIHNMGANFWLSVSKIFNVPFVPKNMQEWLLSVIKDAIENRKLETEARNDFLEIIRNSKDSSGKPISMNTVYGHCTSLLLEGFETSSTTMANCLYELAENLDVQKKLQAEVDAIYDKYEDKITYEAVAEMAYLDKVMHETLRMHPPMLATIKKCTETTTFPPQYPSSKPITVPEGSIIVIPILAIHYDPEIYPQPNAFNPDNFSEEAQAARNKCSFLAFGEGPRICVGQRLGLTQSKAGIAAILRKFNVRISPKTQVPLQLLPDTFLSNARGGIWIDFEPRNNKAA